MRRTLSSLPYLPELISFVDESLVSSASADSYVHLDAPVHLARIKKEFHCLCLFYGDAEAGDGKPDGDSGADGDAYYHYAPLLSVWIELVSSI